MATLVSSIIVSFTTKSDPIVALYVFRNFMLTYWCSSDVFPTLPAICAARGVKQRYKFRGGGMGRRSLTWRSPG
jgi:hypothetical protein